MASPQAFTADPAPSLQPPSSSSTGAKTASIGARLTKGLLAILFVSEFRILAQYCWFGIGNEEGGTSATRTAFLATHVDFMNALWPLLCMQAVLALILFVVK
mmetsp:Transcript_9078/g.23728  ORF Transcript_9078/g.23728 Transcript_9078/m.23728 type:complete len:102 (+) Transcript_9078:35-340(+)